MKILIKDLFNFHKFDNEKTDAMVDVQDNNIAIIELTGERDLTFELKITETDLEKIIIQISNSLSPMGLLVPTENIYVRYTDLEEKKEKIKINNINTDTKEHYIKATMELLSYLNYMDDVESIKRIYKLTQYLWRKII